MEIKTTGRVDRQAVPYAEEKRRYFKPHDQISAVDEWR